MQDLRFAFRVLRKNPGFAVVAIITLALGIGANTAVYSVVHGLLWRALPFPEPDRVVAVRGANTLRGITDYELSLSDLADLKAQAGSFSEFAAFFGRSGSISGPDGADRIEAGVTEPSLFRVVGLPALLGRTLRDDDALAGAEPAVVISYGLWRNRFGGDSSIIGRAVPVDGVSRTVVGVMPAGFDFERVDLWLPLIQTVPVRRDDRFARGVGRLTPGATVEQARQQLVAAAARLEQTYPLTNRGWTVEVLRYRDDIVDPGSRWQLQLMMGAVVVVLLIACANVAGLMLARASARTRELAVRAAIGASRWRIGRQLLIESGLLATAGAAAGLVFAAWWNDALLSTLPAEDVPPWLDASLDGSVLGVTLLATIAATALFGLLPALRASRPDVVTELKEAAPGRGAGNRLRSMLVMGQVAMSIVVLAAAALFVNAFAAARTGDLGFDDRAVLTARAYFRPLQGRPAAERTAWMRGALAQLRAMPGVSAAALTGSIPGDDGGDRVPLAVEGSTVLPGEELLVVAVPTSDGFFEALGSPLLAGRGFTPAEAEAPLAEVAVIGRALAQRLWPGQDPLGRRLRLGGDSTWVRVVGVARDIQYEEFGEDAAADRLQVHVPYGRELWRNVALLVRGSHPGSVLAEPVQRTLRGVSADVPVYAVRTMAEVRSETTASQRLDVLVFGTFGTQALIMAGVGLFGLLAYTVAQRRREIGIRMALGARPGVIVRDVVAQAALLTATGLLLGMAGAWAVANGLRSALWGVTGTLAPLALAVAVLLAAALLAALLPARRAARVDPMVALRAE
jgi:predicted permease